MSLLINKSQKWAFIHIPKTGGTSVNKLLLENSNTEFITSHDSIRIVPDDNYFIFTIVRNPYTRFMSAWLHGIRKGIYSTNFNEFIKNLNENDVWFLPQQYYIEQGKTSNRKISFIVKYENLVSDIKKPLEYIGVHNTIPHLNRNPIYDRHPTLNQEKYYKHLYKDEWMKDLVLERYKNDFTLFNYGLDI